MTNTAATTVISMPNGKGIKSDRQQPNMNDSDDSTSLPSSSEEEPTFRQHSNGTTSSTSEEKPTFREHFKPSSSVVMVRPFPEPPTVSPSSVQVVSAKVEPASAQLVLDSGSDSGKHTRENEKRDSLQQQPTVESSSSAKNWRSRLSTRHVYSRPTQVEQIVSAYERKLAQPEIPAFIVVMGPLGSGKTRLIHDALHDRVAGHNHNGGYLIRGRHDQLCRPEPYPGLVSAFDDLVHQVVQRGPQAVDAMRSAICKAVGDECGVLCRMFPSLKRILGDKQDQMNSSKSEDSLQRFVFVFFLFMMSISSREQPLVLFLDDMQWADPCSVDLISLFLMKKIEGLVFVGAFDDSYTSSYGARKLQELKTDGCNYTTVIRLGALDQGEVNHLVGNVLQLSPRLDLVADIGAIVRAQTNGNIFYIVEFLQWMQDKELLTFNGQTQSWDWDGADIQQVLNNHADSGGYFLEKFAGLSTDMRDVLKVAACFGSQLTPTLIEYVLDFPILPILVKAESMHILSFDDKTGEYSFEHDGIQQAVYQLIPDDGRELFHLEVGRRLWRRLSAETLEHNIFVLLSQMNIGKRLITREKERYSIASLCLHAGKKAAKLSTFRIAMEYLNLAIELLGDRGWRDEYDLALALHNAAAEMNMCTGNFDAMGSIIESVIQNSRSPGDQIQALSTKIYGMGMNDQHNEAIELGIKVMASLGVKFPRIRCKRAMMSELRSVQRLLRGKSNEQLMRLPNITDEGVLACLQILNVMYMHCILFRQELTPFVTLKMMKITLTKGLSLIASTAFATFGIFCISVLHDADAAFRFGELALELNNRLKAKVYLPRVHAAFYGCVYAWKRPIRDTLSPLLIAHRVGLLTGDVEYSSLTANLYCFNSFDSGVPLEEIERFWSGVQRTMLSYQQSALHRMSLPTMQAIQFHLGRLEDTKDIETLIQKSLEMRKPSSSTNFFIMEQVRTAYVFNEFELADRLVKQIKGCVWNLPPTFEIVSMTFISGMVALAMALNGKQVRRNRRIAQRMISFISCMARACPTNCLDKKFLLQAELAAVRGHADHAFELYTCAMALAHAQRFVHIEALANERCARFFLRSGDNEKEAIVYFDRAVTLYEKWGSIRKVERLRQEATLLFEQFPPPPPSHYQTATTTTATSTPRT